MIFLCGAVRFRSPPAHRTSHSEDGTHSSSVGAVRIRTPIKEASCSKKVILTTSQPPCSYWAALQRNRSQPVGVEHNMFHQNDSLWSILKTFSTLKLLFCLILTLVVIYTLFSSTFIVLRLRSLRAIQDGISLRKSFVLLKHRSTNLRQLIVAVSYLFGLVFFLQIQFAFLTTENGRPIDLMVFDNFRAEFRFAAVIFLVFFLIHSVQWFVSFRIRKAMLQLDAQILQ